MAVTYNATFTTSRGHKVFLLLPIIELWREYRDIYAILYEDAKTIAEVFSQAKPDLAEKGIVVRLVDPRLDFGLTNDKWEVSVTAGTDVSLLTVTLPHDKAMIIRGFRIPSPDPLVDVIYLKKDKYTSEKLFVRFARDPNLGICLFRRAFKYEPNKKVEIYGNVNTSGTEIIQPIALVAEQRGTTVDWFEERSGE